MAADSDRPFWVRVLVPRSVRRLPADLAAVLAVVALTNFAVLVPVVRETPLRIVFGLPFVLFVPGYAFVAALFPEAGVSPDESFESDTTGSEAAETASSRVRGRGGIDGIERVALSFGLSIAVVPLLGLVLNFTPWGIRLVPILVAVSGFTVACTAVAVWRRRDLPEEERFSVPYKEWTSKARSELLEPDTRTDAALNVLLVASVLLAAASVTYAVAVPKQGEAFTEFYLLTEDEDGDLVADDYPTEFVRGEPKPLVIGVGNHEHEPVDYTVVVELHRVRFEQANNSTRVVVLEETELRRFHPSLPHNETWHRTYEVAPTMTGENLRLAFLLYREDPPANPTVDNAYRETHLWVNVSRPSTDES